MIKSECINFQSTMRLQSPSCTTKNGGDASSERANKKARHNAFEKSKINGGKKMLEELKEPISTLKEDIMNVWGRL